MTSAQSCCKESQGANNCTSAARALRYQQQQACLDAHRQSVTTDPNCFPNATDRPSGCPGPRGFRLQGIQRLASDGLFCSLGLLEKDPTVKLFLKPAVMRGDVAAEAACRQIAVRADVVSTCG